MDLLLAADRKCIIIFPIQEYRQRDIVEDFENGTTYFCTFLAIEKLLAGFNMQPRIGMNQSSI